MKTLHTSDNLQVVHYLNSHIMYCNWVGPQDKQAVVQSGVAILKLLQENHFTKVLNDNTHVTGPWNTSVTWTIDEWFPAMTQSGLRHFAWILSPNIFASLSAKRAIPPRGPVKIFLTYNDALLWLTSTS